MKAQLKTSKTDVSSPVLVYVTSNKRLILMEMQGPVEAMRAIWAHIVKNRQATTSHDPTVPTDVNIDGKKIMVDPKDRYRQVSEAGHLFIIHSGFLQTERKFIMGGTDTEPSPYFFQFLQRQVPSLPFLEEWIPQLWRLGVANELILPCKTQGTSQMFWEVPEQYYYRRKPYSWRKAVQEVLGVSPGSD